MIRSNTRPSPWRVSRVRRGPCFVWTQTNNQLTLRLESESSDWHSKFVWKPTWEHSLRTVFDGRESLILIKVDTGWLTKFRNIVHDWKCSINVKRDPMTGALSSFTTPPHNILDSDSPDILNPFSLECLIHGNHNSHETLDWCQINAVKLRCLGPFVIGPIAVGLRKRVFKWQFCWH